MKKLFTWALPLAALTLAAGCRLSPSLADDWCARVVAPCARQLARASGRLTFPLAELLALVLAPSLIVSLVRKRRFARAALVFPLTTCIALWYPLYFAASARPWTADPPADPAALNAMADMLIERLNASAAVLPEPDAVPGLAAAALSALGEAPFQPVEALPKVARYPEWMQSCRLSGLYVPWTAEALYSPAQPLAAQIFTACHELAHLSGIADEGQANIAAYRACTQAGGPAARSAWLHALSCVLPRLYQADPNAWMLCAARLSPAVRTDLRAMGGLAAARDRPNAWIAVAEQMLGLAPSLSDYSALADYLAAHGID